jgi:FkbM family methyltransferase
MIDDLIFDLGMNNGDDTDFYLAKGFKVIAVEANPDLCVLAKERFTAAIGSGRLHIVSKAIANSTGEIDLFINEQVSGWTTTNPDWVKARALQGTRDRIVRVPAVTLQELIREFGVPYYMKADIQGAEFYCLEALREFPERPRFVSIGPGSMASGPRAIRGFRRGIELLLDLGYHKFQIVRQDQTELQKCPLPAREGTYVDYKFKHGCSGLFGRELPGEWIDAKKALREYWKIALSYMVAGNSGSPYGWFNKLPSRAIRYYLDRIFWRGTAWYDTHAIHE